VCVCPLSDVALYAFDSSLRQIQTCTLHHSGHQTYSLLTDHTCSLYVSDMG